MAYAGVWRINDGKLVKRLTDTRMSGVVSRVDVTRDGHYVIAVHSPGGHVVRPDHVIIYDVNTEQVRFDDCTQSNVVQIMTTDHSDMVRTYSRVETSCQINFCNKIANSVQFSPLFHPMIRSDLHTSLYRISHNILNLSVARLKCMTERM